MAVLPHLILWIKTRDATYIPDWDGVLYLAWSRDIIFRGGWGLVDAVHPSSGPMMHPWILFGPIALLARVLGLNMLGLAILWRIGAAICLTASLSFALRPFLKTPRLVAVVSLFLLFDSGFQGGEPIQGNWRTLYGLMRHPSDLFGNNPTIMNHFRVVTPAFAFPFLFLHFGLVWRARLRPTSRAVLLAGMSFGLLFYAYFYFWTAVLLGTTLAWLLDPKGRALHARILIVGTLIGLPSLIDNYRLKNSLGTDWLTRTEKFAPMGRTENLIVFRVLLLKYAIAGVWIFRKRRELIQVWCAGIAGMALSDHQLLTRLNIENFHWTLIAGCTWSLLAAILIVGWAFDTSEKQRLKAISARESSAMYATRAFLTVALTLQIPLGIFLRSQESTRPRSSQRLETDVLNYHADAPLFPIPPGSVVAGDGDFFMVAAALAEIYPLNGRLVDFCSKADDQEMEERLMLNFFLFGYTPAQARAIAEDPAGTLQDTWWIGFNPRGDRIPKIGSIRSTLIKPIWDDPKPWLAKYRVDYVVLPMHSTTRSAQDYLSKIADRVAVGRTWECWKISFEIRRAVKPAAATRRKTPRQPDRS